MLKRNLTKSYYFWINFIIILWCTPWCKHGCTLWCRDSVHVDSKKYSRCTPRCTNGLQESTFNVHQNVKPDRCTRRYQEVHLCTPGLGVHAVYTRIYIRCTQNVYLDVKGVYSVYTKMYTNIPSAHQNIHSVYTRMYTLM